MNLPEQILIAIEQHSWTVLTIGLFILVCLVITRTRNHIVIKRIIHEKGNTWEANWKEHE